MMNNSAILWRGYLEQLTARPDYINLVIGTGAFARDMQRKLRLLGLEAPFLIGDYTDDARGVRHYSVIPALGDPGRYRFIVCCDRDELDMMSAAQIEAYRLVGNVSFQHPQVIVYYEYAVLQERAGRRIPDAANSNVIISESGRHYEVFGDADDPGAFHIHVLGGCVSGGVYRFGRSSFAQWLYENLRGLGFQSVVYSWEQINTAPADHVMTFLRDVAAYKKDLVLMTSWLADPLHYTEKNALAARNGVVGYAQPFHSNLKRTYADPVSNGGSHDVSQTRIREVQHRTFAALARLGGFAFWDIIFPGTKLLPEKIAGQMRRYSPGYHARRRAEKDKLIALIGKENIRDYTGCFAEADDVFTLFADYAHFSDLGNRLLADRCAAEIRAELAR